jgi:hypothetical protein
MTRILSFILLLAGTTTAQTQAAPVYSDAGNIFIEHGGSRNRLTNSEMDADPILAPNGAFVVYTRQGRGRSPRANKFDQTCPAQPRTDELRRVNVDGSGDQLLLMGRSGGPERQLCNFTHKQFNSDARRLYFLTPAWATSKALHVYDLRAGEAHYLAPANDVVVLNFCNDKYKDHLVVEQHRYFLLGGSYDWYWLYDAAGKKELGPLGPATHDDIVRQAHGLWCDGKP